MCVKGGVANFFLGQSIGIDETNTFQLKFLKKKNFLKIVGVTGIRGVGVKVGVANFFLRQSIGLMRTIHFS